MQQLEKSTPPCRAVQKEPQKDIQGSPWRRTNRTFRDIQRYSEIFRDIQRYSEIFRDIQRYSEIFRDIQRYSEIFRDIQRYSEIFSRELKESFEEV